MNTVRFCWKRAFEELVKVLDDPERKEIAGELQALAEQWETEVELEMRKIRAEYTQSDMEKVEIIRECTDREG